MLFPVDDNRETLLPEEVSRSGFAFGFGGIFWYADAFSSSEEVGGTWCMPAHAQTNSNVCVPV